MLLSKGPHIATALGWGLTIMLDCDFMHCCGYFRALLKDRGSHNLSDPELRRTKTSIVVLAWHL